MAELATAPDAYAYWRNALLGILGPVHDGAPQPGFYRRRTSKGGPWQPVAIWHEPGRGMVALAGTEDAAVDTLWLSCARHPVSHEDYQHRMDKGAWPGALDLGGAPRDGLEELIGPPPAGDNRPPEGADAAIADVDELVARAKAWANGRTIASQADADHAEALVAELAKAGKAAEAAHKVEKAPHLEAGRKVDGKWKPVIDSASGAVRMLKGLLTPFLQAREREKREAASQAIAAGAEPARADLKARTSGTAGRKISLRSVKRAKVTDVRAALLFFADHPEITALVQRLADKVASVGGSVPGVEVVTEEVAQ